MHFNGHLLLFIEFHFLSSWCSLNLKTLQRRADQPHFAGEGRRLKEEQAARSTPALCRELVLHSSASTQRTFPKNSPPARFQALLHTENTGYPAPDWPPEGLRSQHGGLQLNLIACLLTQELCPRTHRSHLESSLSQSAGPHQCFCFVGPGGA